MILHLFSSILILYLLGYVLSLETCAESSVRSNTDGGVPDIATEYTLPELTYMYKAPYNMYWKKKP